MEPEKIRRVIKSQLMRRLHGYDDDLINHPAIRTYKWHLQPGGKPSTITLEVSEVEVYERETALTLKITENDGGLHQEMRLNGVMSALKDWHDCALFTPPKRAGGTNTVRMFIRTDRLVELVRKLKSYGPKSSAS